MNKIVTHVFLWVLYIVSAVAFKANNLDLWYAIKHTLAMLPIHMITYYGFGTLAVNNFFEKKEYKLFALTAVIFFVILYFLMITLIVPNFEEYYRLIPGSPVNREQRVVAVTVILSLSISTIFHVLENKIIQEKKSQLLLTKHNEAQLTYLKAQINPHFLFNALNNIYSLSVVKSNKTPEMVLNLADLLRYSIYEGQKEKVLLKKEIEHIEKYIELFQSSQENPLNIVFNYDKNIINEIIEPMMLIPIVENCIKHGNLATDADSFVFITLKLDTNKLYFKTINSTNKENVQKDTVGGVGLKNIKTRLELKYENEHTFEIKDNGNTFEVILIIQKLEKL